MPTAPPPIVLGHIDIACGSLLILDAGLAKRWRHEKDPAADERLSAADLEITGPDRWQAGRAFDRQVDPLHLYDIPNPEVMTERFRSFCREEGFQADIRPHPHRIPHLQRARHALEVHQGFGIVQFGGLWAAVIGGLPVRALEVRGHPMPPGEFEGRWREVEIVVDDTAKVARSGRLEGITVEHGQFLFTDLENFGRFRAMESLDGLGDFVFWGLDAPNLAATANAAELGQGHYGWQNLPLKQIQDHAQSCYREIDAKGWKIASDYRPHGHLEQLNSQIRTNDLRVASLKLDQLRLLAMNNRWGDRLFSAVRDLDAKGCLVRLRIETGTEDRQRLMRQVWLRQQSAIITDRVRRGEKIHFAERSEPLNPWDSGWLFSAGTESQAEVDNANLLHLEPIKAILQREPALRDHLVSPIGTRLRWEQNRFVIDDN